MDGGELIRNPNAFQVNCKVCQWFVPYFTSCDESSMSTCRGLRQWSPTTTGPVPGHRSFCTVPQRKIDQHNSLNPPSHPVSPPPPHTHTHSPKISRLPLCFCMKCTNPSQRFCIIFCLTVHISLQISKLFGFPHWYIRLRFC